MENDGYECSGVSKIREFQKEINKDIRIRKKAHALEQNRENLNEVERSLKPISVNEIKELATKLSKHKTQVDLLHQIKNAACLSDDHIEAVLRVQGALSNLIGVLCKNDTEKQFAAVACLTNLATGSHKSTQKVAKAAGAYLVTYMQGGSCFLQSQCAWAAGNIANDCEKCFEILKAQGLLPALKPLFLSPFPDVVESAIFALCCCSRYEFKEMSEMTEDGLTESLLSILTRSDISHRTSVETTFILSNICDKVSVCPIDQQKLIDFLLNQLQKSVSTDEMDVLLAIPTIRCLSNLTVSTDLSNLLCSNIFQKCIVSIVGCKHQHIAIETLCLINNILIACPDVTTYSCFWQEVLQHIFLFLSPLHTGVMPALYLLCTLKSRWPNFSNELKILGLAESLCNCERRDIEEAAKVLLS